MVMIIIITSNISYYIWWQCSFVCLREKTFFMFLISPSIELFKDSRILKKINEETLIKHTKHKNIYYLCLYECDIGQKSNSQLSRCVATQILTLSFRILLAPHIYSIKFMLLCVWSSQCLQYIYIYIFQAMAASDMVRTI